jgi:hypothetical protein
MFLSEHDRDLDTDRKHNQLWFWPILSRCSLENLLSRMGNVLRFVRANLTELDESEVE